MKIKTGQVWKTINVDGLAAGYYLIGEEEPNYQNRFKYKFERTLNKLADSRFFHEYGLGIWFEENCQYIGEEETVQRMLVDN